MKITGYKIIDEKEIMSCSGLIELKNCENNGFVFFLKIFPDLEKEFYSGETFRIKLNKESLLFLEKLIKDRLKYTIENATWKKEFNDQKINFLKKGNRIYNLEFGGEVYEINNFGQRNLYNRITETLISLYERLKSPKDKLGVKVIPEITIDDIALSRK